MKRNTFQFVALLILGAAINVVIAWGCHCAFWPKNQQRVPALKESEIARFDRVTNQSSGAPTFHLRYASFGCMATGIAEHESRYGTLEFKRFAYLYDSGWPCASLGGEAWYANPPEIVLSFNFGGGVPGPRWTKDFFNRPFPISLSFLRRPLWPGFAINTIFYAAMLWMMFASPFAVRRSIRRRRIRRGLCPACAYPTWGGGTSPVCTECGVPFKISSE